MSKMISSKINIEDNTFSVVLDSEVEVSGIFKIIVVRSNSLCALNFQVDCNRHNPPADSSLEEKINFIAAQHEISKKLSEYSFNHIQFKMFPHGVEEQDVEDNGKANKK